MVSAAGGPSNLVAAEREPLLHVDDRSDTSKSYASVEVRDVPPTEEDADRIDCLLSTASLIFNRVIGTGIFATPSVILRSSGSVGLSLVMWLLGAAVALCGTAVYIELGTGLPRNGGEKNYLEVMFRRPKLLVTCIYAMVGKRLLAPFLENVNKSGFRAESGAHPLSCPTDVLHAWNPKETPSPTTARLAGVLCITVALFLHGTMLKTGLRIQNTLGLFKLSVLIGIALSGLASLLRVKGFKLENRPHNFEWDKMWEGSLRGGANAFVTGLFNVIWCFIGYSNANYALAEVRDPVRTIKRAAPIAMLSVTLVYFLVNIAYLAVVDKKEIVESGRIVAALHFGKLWGVGAERVVSVIVAFSTLGNILAVLFTHGRVVQELGREGVLPFSSLFASNKPFGAPFAGLFEQWLVTSALVLLVPPGDAYLFMLNLSSYPLALINMFVSGGLLFIHLPDRWLSKSLKGLRASYAWHPPFKAWTLVVLFFFLSNIFLVAVPLMPPSHGYQVYEYLPYWVGLRSHLWRAALPIDCGFSCTSS
ncbi:hypothetical protein BN946_scf184921.g39 [Trametes cinnabarina]|uniref:Amino acid permease/ SLC12A domain-containing protein n=1 Tax=Pycnoporus cinnabarinus TaxID=5643 RepID=A0A060STI4_PYCCI|nr:hypothetical protein BN946_scf184921.g39 [Trametes cinnabarina]